MSNSLWLDLGIRFGVLLVTMKDGAAINQVALQQVRFIFLQILSATCFPHNIVIDIVLKHFELRVLETFARYLVSMFSHSPAARLGWKSRNRTPVQAYSPTRWWSKYGVIR